MSFSFIKAGKTEEVIAEVADQPVGGDLLGEEVKALVTKALGDITGAKKVIVEASGHGGQKAGVDSYITLDLKIRTA